ncbi:regulatory protein [Cupriavidus sp. SK-3]|uniref:LysR family transcriptional regulator n=1 Tax=Cupriavidus TaxID=106589 RepID=UPI00044B7AC6|nr:MULTISPECIES: LysR family transcriptional regulator [Cupriavidus]KDP87423.1 regulatory protein [Cupriavidus sp. SK-3]MDF3884994.1 LysR family transcriptional regulator [Cupriavidus basilensis]
MELDAYLFFATVVESGSFMNASLKLGIDRSNVSRRIRKLESDVEAQLVRRSTRRMSLTEIGEAFYAQCAVIRAEVERADELLHTFGTSIRGPLRVSCPPAVGRLYLTAMFAEFCNLYPKVSLSVTFKGGAVDLMENDLDLALRVTNDPGEQCVARALAPIEWMLCANPEYLERHGRPVTPEDLASHTCLGVRTRVGLEYVREGSELLHRVPIQPHLECSDYGFLGEMAAAKLGIGLLPSYVAAEHLQSGRLETVLNEYRLTRSPGGTLYAITLPNRYTPPQLRAFLDFLKCKFEQGLPWEKDLMRTGA